MITAKILLAYLLQATDVTGLSIDTSKIDPQEAYCLAQTIFYEARNEEIKGQFAVASVTVNRTKDLRFPDTICKVVKYTAKSKITNKSTCAFSWYCENDKRGKDIPIENKNGTINQSVVDQFKLASIIAITVLGGETADITKGATHFHNPYVSNPAWTAELKKTVTIGNHSFYRMYPQRIERIRESISD